MQCLNKCAVGITDSSQSVADVAIPSSSKRQDDGRFGNRIAGWSVRVQPVRDCKSLLRRNLWPDCGRSRSVFVAARMRAAYHYFIRKAKRDDENMTDESRFSSYSVIIFVGFASLFARKYRGLYTSVLYTTRYQPKA